jgi:hypothetical protein
MFNIDLNWVIQALLPPFLRKDAMVAWLTSLVSQSQYLWAKFDLFRESMLDRVSFTSQVVYLEKLLNDKFNSYPDPIFISDVVNEDFVYLSNQAEEFEPIYIATASEDIELYIGNYSEYAGQFDFMVNVPTLLYSELTANNNALFNEMKAQINYYRLAGKRYLIQPY